MKKILFLISTFLLIPSLLWASPPARSFTYSSGSVISPSEVTQNEDNIFNYLSTGVDTIAPSVVTTSHILDGTIANADISGTAAILGSKLDLAIAPIIGATTPAAGTFTTGTFTTIGATTINAFALGGKITGGANEIEGSNFDIDGGTIDGVTIGATSAPTVTNLGSVTTADINGGTIDGVTIGGASAGAGTFTDLSSTGTTTIGNATGDALTINPSAWTLANAVTITGTWANLGAITTTGTFGLGGKLTAGANEIEGSNFDITGGTIIGITSFKLNGATSGNTTITPAAAAGTTIVQLPAANSVTLPSGAVFFMITGSCPTGTTDVTSTYSNKFIKINATQGTSSGTVLTGTSDSHTLTTTEMPAHTHGAGYSASGSAGSLYSIGGAVAAPEVLTSSTGSGGGHTHTLSSATTLEPSSITMKCCQVN